MIFFDCHKKPHKLGDQKAGWRVSVYACIINQDQEILVIKTILNDYFCLPGGGVEICETIEQGLKRECAEEIGCDIEISGDPIFLGETNFYDIKSDKFLHSINIFYQAKIIKENKNFKIDGREVVGFEWKKLDDLFPEMMFFNIAPFIADFKKNTYE